MTATTNSGQSIDKAVFRWHRWLVSQEQRRERAELRRLKQPTDAVYCDGYHALLERVESENPSSTGLRVKLCYLAALLAHLDSHDPSRRVAAAMAASRAGSPVVSRLRFRRLLSRPDLKDLYPSLQRTLKLLEKKADMQDLTHSLLNWNERTRQRWAFAYYDALFAKKNISS